MNSFDPWVLLHPAWMVLTLIWGVRLLILEIQGQSVRNGFWVAGFVALLLSGGLVGRTASLRLDLSKESAQYAQTPQRSDPNRPVSPFPSDQISEQPRPPITGEAAEIRDALVLHRQGAILAGVFALLTLAFDRLKRRSETAAVRMAYRLGLGATLLGYGLQLADGVAILSRLGVFQAALR